jgi:DNA recombination protein RmuC
MGRALADLRETSGRTEAQLTADLRAARDGLASTTAELQNERSQRNAVESDNAQLGASLKGLEERHEAEQRNTTEKLHLLLDAKEALTNQFKSLANDILEEKSRRFTEQNQANLTQLLDPLRANITAFQAKVEEVYVQEGKDRSALSQHVRQLFELTQTLSKDAKNLTSALRGSSRTQGSWGELVLERILEASGLRKGEEYVTQESQGSADGRRQQPDVVINLPEQRSLVVDAKVSLVAYERFVAAETDSDRDTALRQHLDSVRTHIRGLSERNYQALYGLNSLDFVLMFVPVEPAFMLAVTNEPELFMDAWHRNVLLVSPSTLLFVLRTVGHLWRQEAQRRNAQEIADRGGELYDRLVLFAEDLKVVGDRINAAQSAYACAESKLSQGKGNVIWQAEMLRELGVTPSKQIPQSFLELTAADEDGLQIMPVAGTNRAGSNSPSIDSAH